MTQLIDYLEARGVQIAESRRADIYRMQNIKAFSFGERYVAHLYTGQMYDFDDLESILDVLTTMFATDSLLVPLISINAWQEVLNPEFGRQYRKHAKSQVDPLKAGSGIVGRAKDRVLVAVPALASTAFPMPPTSTFVEQIRTAVVSYNLQGNSWDNFDKGNV